MQFPTHYSAPSSGISLAHLDLPMRVAALYMGTSWAGWATVLIPAILFGVAAYRWSRKRTRVYSDSDAENGPGNGGKPSATGRLSSQDAANAFGASRAGKAVDEEMERRAALRRRREERDSADLDRIADEDAELLIGSLSEADEEFLTASRPGGDHSHISGSGNAQGMMHCEMLSETCGARQK